MFQKVAEAGRLLVKVCGGNFNEKVFLKQCKWSWVILYCLSDYLLVLLTNVVCGTLLMFVGFVSIAMQCNSSSNALVVFPKVAKYLGLFRNRPHLAYLRQDWGSLLTNHFGGRPDADCGRIFPASYSFILLLGQRMFLHLLSFSKRVPHSNAEATTYLNKKAFQAICWREEISGATVNRSVKWGLQIFWYGDKLERGEPTKTYRPNDLEEEGETAQTKHEKLYWFVHFKSIVTLADLFW